ncbi:MAG: hypothetical protein J5755_04005 [Clostridia bacterium]|nr:hypothetical protein [Clostridia bacterium]
MPRTPEIDNLPLVRQAIANNQSKQIRTIAILFAVFIVVAMCIWATTTVVHKKNQISYYSDATYQEVQCRVINVYEESGLLCIEAEIMTGGDSLQPIDGRYRFAFVSESAKMAHLTIDDVIIIKSTIFKGNQINAYLVAYLEKNEFSYVDFNTGKQDVLYWQATHF